jgi:hypothetical protein
MFMQDRFDGFFAAFKREPDQTKWLVRIGVGVPLLIVAWNFVGREVTSSIVVGLVDLLAMMAYGIALSVVTVRIMRASERWTVESAVTARRFSDTVQGREEAEPLDAKAAVHSTFQQANFLARLKDDVAKARRDGDRFCIVWLDVQVPGTDVLQAQTDKMALDVAELLGGQANTIGHSLDLSLNEYVFTIPHHSKSEGRAFLSKLILGLGRYWCHCGIVEYPADVTDAEGLFARARALCEASRQGKDIGKEARSGMVAAS